MGTRSKDRIKAMIAKDTSNIYNRCMEVKKFLNDNLEDTLDYLRALLAQIPQSTSGPLITKTPKVIKKRGVQRIETIPEDDIINIDNTVSNSIALHDKTETINIKKENVVETTISRTKRKASKIAEDNINRQQSLKLNLKLRQPSNFPEDSHAHKKRESRTKRKKHARSSSDEDTAQGPAKHSKTEESIVIESSLRKTNSTKSQNHASIAEDTLKEDKSEAPKESPMTRRSSTRKRSFSESQNFNFKKPNTIDDTVIAPTGNDIAECSMYEDAIEKPTPIMNSTMNLNSTITLQKMMNATVVLEPLSAIKLNETVTISKNFGNNIEKSNKQQKPVQEKTRSKSGRLSKLVSSSSESLQDRMQKLKEVMVNKEFDELLTEDESSPEVIKQGNRKQQNRVLRLSTSSNVEEVLSTPAKPFLKEMNTVTGFHEAKNTFKSNALFSPYAKESVKKRVEAFEQAGMHSPKPVVDIDAPTRVTRTKTRAIAAAKAEAAESTKTSEKTVAHKLARKSLAKAKKISLAKQIKNADEFKENKVQSAQKVHKLLPTEKMHHKQQQKTTPLSKMKTHLPMSVNRITHTPSNQINTNDNKALSAVRTNIITTVESFIHQPKSVNKRNSIDKIEEKKRKLNEEDGRKKREEALRLQTEEKRRKRQEKELKNKLAREAKEKQDMEKRQKAEKEREEKARIAQQVQEKQREEMERKRLAQLQRAQEKEERRRQEEQQRLLRLQEQEEAERILAEQKRRELEAEKRKETELRAQQQLVAEAAKTKNQFLLAQAKSELKHHGPTNYILDSEPDDEESDDESRPKHVIPYWAQSQVRRAQLAVQRYIPDRAVYKFFDTRKCTPDLSQLFQGIDRSRLKRTSSAVWKTPPRYSMMETE
ncbi:Inner centromere protein A [Habropoda laboriosa]|uniref:Inner centromere protein A n=1 Tax=Habropoda laboriosa TaxID=597456 RepID=A0A0L7R5X5_9HYME|nr:PREDICTED: inner centromere protein [Habropoda laboriosa]KOC66275.1 Inner centromere protein A [Habropoda laboriosa]